MNASREPHSSNTDIDLIELFNTLWKRKVTITLVGLLLGVLCLVYLLVSSGKYAGEFILREPAGTQVGAYAPLNDNIKEHYKKFLTDTGRYISTNVQFEITSKGLLQDIVRNLQNNTAFETALKTHSADVRNMSESEFSDVRKILVSKFSVKDVTQKNPNAYVTLNWSDPDELSNILHATLTLAQQQLNATNLEFLYGLADNIERRNSAQIKALEQEIASLVDAIDFETQSRLLFLREQATIARELNLADNILTQGSQVSLNLTPLGQAAKEGAVTAPGNSSIGMAYLGGYKSLEKEVALIESRTKEQNYSLDVGYVAMKRELLELQNNEDAKQFREVIKASPFASGADVFNIQKSLITVNNLRNKSLILVLSVLFGIFTSCVFILVKGAFQRYSDV